MNTLSEEELAPLHSSTLERYRSGFLACQEEAQALTGGLSTEAFNRPPAPGKWSAGQCLDHLLEAARPLVPRLKETIRTLPKDSSGSAQAPRYGLFEQFFIWMNSPRGWLKIPAPGAYRPDERALDPAQTLAAFRTLQDDLAACATAADGRDVTAGRVPSPASRFLRLSPGAWLKLTLAHQRRHLRQARAAAPREGKAQEERIG